MFKLSQLIFKQPESTKRLSSLIKFNLFATSTTIAETKNIQEQNIAENVSSRAIPKRSVTSTKVSNNMVAAAFASLHSEENSGEDIKTPITDEKITKAKNVNELLSISEGSGVSRKHALKVVSVLAEWYGSGKIKLTDFEADSRFVRLCRILSKNSANQKINRNSLASRSEDLSMVLSVTADDEAARLIGSITFPQMVKVMSTLSQKKRRSTMLLRALAYNITASPDRLNLKQSADLLYSMSVLNFPDDNLLARVGNDVSLELEEKEIRGSAVVGSIITSVGLLKYKNPGLLDALSEWILKNHALSRPQDIFSLFMTLAVLNYFPTNSESMFKALVPQLSQSEAGKPNVWLEVIWSLVLLGQATPKHISSILEDSFIAKLQNSDCLNTSSKLKLLNINAAATHLVENYSGPKLSPDSEIRHTEIALTKDKNEMVDAIIDALKNLIHSEKCLRTKVNTGHGFFVDAECLLDKKCHPLPLNSPRLGVDATKVAILAYDYHDMCRDKVEPTGINVLVTKLLEAQSYKVLTVPYNEFKPIDKIVHRVQYLESKLKEVIKS